MVTQKKMLPGSRIKLTITATADQFRQAFDKELESVGKTVQVAGFRAGKAPKAQVLQKAGQRRVEAGALDILLSDAYFSAVKEEKLVPVAGPDINITEYTAPDDSTEGDKAVLTFTAEVDIVPEVDVSGYKKIKLKKPSAPEVKEDEVERVIEYLRKQQASTKEVDKDASLQNGMWADIAYEGSVGGVKRSDMANKNHPLVIGEGQLIPGFEEGIIGMKQGEEKTITLTFPKDYHSQEVAGKKAEFKVSINEMKEMLLPEKDDAFAANFGHKTFAELEKAIRQNLHDEKDEQSRKELEEQVVEQLLKVAKLEVPVSLVEQELERMYTDAKKRLEGMNFQWDTYLSQTGKTVEQIREEMRPQAEKNVRVGLALGKVIQEEKIEDKERAGQIALDRLIELATS